MKILVAGGAGFLGSHLCERLLANGHSVTAIDNLLTGRRCNINHLFAAKNFCFIEHDVIEPFAGQYDQIYNLACPASPPKYQEDPLRTLRTSFIGTDRLLDLASRIGARFLQASTSEIYGDPLVHPQTEDYRGNVNPVGPRACYDEGKRVAETLCFDYKRVCGTPIRIARIFNTYGPRMDSGDGRVVSNFIIQALRGTPLTVYGDGSQTRSFCYVDDLVEGLMRLMQSTSEIGGPVNLGNPTEFTVLQLATKVIQLLNSPSKIAFEPLPIDDPRQRRPDITAAKRLLSWSPKIELQAGLLSTIRFFQAEEAQRRPSFQPSATEFTTAGSRFNVTSSETGFDRRVAT